MAIRNDEDLANRLLRTWLEFLVQGNFKEIAALTVDAELSIERGGAGWASDSLYIDLPSSAYIIIIQSSHKQDFIRNSLNTICKGYFFDQNGNIESNLEVVYRVKLQDSEENWRQIVKDMIVNSFDANQATISSKAFARRNRSTISYNEMTFASNSEVRIAQELEQRQVLFFPLPLAVRADTGNMYEDHKEPDFLICNDGVWGILEVAYHPDRYEKDAEKERWWHKSGILCIRHYPFERCLDEPSTVVDEFLNILAKYKR